jgi:hypothetical protein
VPESLGEHPHFVQWRDARAWGSGSASFGPGVLSDLVRGIDDYAAENPDAAAIGCVYLLTSVELASKLANLASVCIVVDKGAASAAVEVLEKRGRDFPLQALPGHEISVTSGGWNEVEPLRIVGFKPEPGERNRPLLHAKMLVLGSLEERWLDSGVGEFSMWGFEPRRVWIGSANWTVASKKHVELGLWIDDARLVSEATEFVSQLIGLSEPFTSEARIPTPELKEWEPDYDTWLG